TYEVRARHQPENRQGACPHDPAVSARARRRDRRVASVLPGRKVACCVLHQTDDACLDSLLAGTVPDPRVATASSAPPSGGGAEHAPVLGSGPSVSRWSVGFPPED